MSKLMTTAIQGYYDTKIKAWVTAADEKVLADSKDYADGKASVNKGLIDGLDGRVTEAEGNIGNLETLNTTAKEDLVKAINEVRNSVSAGGTAAAITITTDTTTTGALKSYTLKQGTNTVGVIDIPKDMVVESGSVVNNPSGQPAGTYIKLVLANVADPLFINVGTLVDIYTAAASATQVQLTINSNTREISATIVAGGVGTTELADNAVTTVKIADANVTLAKLSSAVQTSLGKADSAVQNVEEGTTNGTIKVDGTNVPVHGLGSAAYKADTAFDAAGAAAGVQANLDTEASRAKAAESKALEDAKAYTDQKIGGVDLSGIATNANAIDALTTRVQGEETKSTDFESRIAELEGVEYATEADIDAMFPTA